MPRDRACARCPLGDGAKNICVWGEGPAPAEIMFLGRNPGYDEDREGRPFVGRAGQLLREVAKWAGLKEGEIYFSNLVKCVSPHNRPPTAAEIAACQVYLEEELAQVRPRFIFAFGNEAWAWLTGRRQGGITSIVGTRPLERPDGSLVFPMPHPSYYVRQGGLEDHPGGRRARQEFQAHFQRYVQVVRAMQAGASLDEAWESPRPRVHICRSLADVRRALDALAAAECVAVDVETQGLYPDPGRALRTIQLSGDGRTAWVIPWEHSETPPDIAAARTEIAAALGRLLAEKKVVAHHAQFDLLWLWSRGIGARATFDTKLAAHLLNENADTGLKAQVSAYLRGPDYGLDMSRSEHEEHPLDVLGEYGGLDAAYTWQLREFHLARLREEKRLVALMRHLIVPGLHLFTEVTRNGLGVDWQYVAELEGRLAGRRAEIEAALAALMPKSPCPRPPARPPHPALVPEAPPAGPPAYNWAGDDAGILLFDGLGAPYLDAWRTERVQTLSLSDERLRDLLDVVEEELAQRPDDAGLLRVREAVGLLREFGDVTKLAGFIAGWRREARADGRLHPDYRWDGTVTGRTSCRNPNIQQVPRTPEVRRCFVAGDGWLLIAVDFSQIELRLIAHESRDPVMLAVFRDPDGDIHTETAAAVTGKPREQVTAEDRRRAKAVNFGLCYGMGPQKFRQYARYQYDVVMTQEEAEAAYQAYFQRYAELKRWHERRKREALERGYVVSVLGRKRRLEKVWSPSPEERSLALRQAINAPIQSAASDIAILACLLLERDEAEIRPLAFVHDAWLFAVRPDVADRWCARIKETFEEATCQALKERFGLELAVPLRVDIAVGPSWGEVRAWTPP